MENIDRLFERFAEAYRHSLYAIQREKNRIDKERSEARENVRKTFEKERKKLATGVTNKLSAGMHRLNDAYRELSETEDSVIKAAEYLAYGVVVPEKIDKLIFSDNTLPWVMPLLGHGNVYIESGGDACHTLGLQIAVNALMQTAPGQLSITVINPELRPEFSALNKVADFTMLTREREIEEKLTSITEEIIETDMLLQGRYSSLVELRKTARQPVGRLQLLVIQDLPEDMRGDTAQMIAKIAKGAPRAGIAVIFLNSRSSKTTSSIAGEIKDMNNFFVFVQKGGDWKCGNAGFEDLQFDFPVLLGQELGRKIDAVVDASKSASAITIPFSQIEDTGDFWSHSSASNIEFSLGKAGMDTVSVCLGDKVSQQHNILISGAAGRGKSNLLEVMIHSLCTRYSPDELELYLLDFKDGLTFKPYASFADGSWLPHARMLGIESDRDVGVAVLKDLEQERYERAIMFGKAGGGVHDYESYRLMYPDRKLPRIVLVIDEYQKLFDVSDDIADEASALLENLVRQGRACAIHVILASQTITGAVGLLGKEDKIYGQFPVRIALQNTVTESYSLFGIGNDAAAKLRVRGEAVINESYGALDQNRKFTVAFAEPSEMKKLRQAYCGRRSGGRHPVIFTKDDVLEFNSFIPAIKNWRRMASEESALRLPYGMRVSVNREVLSLTMSNDTGRNVAILGAAEDLQSRDAVQGKNNVAVGMMQGFGLALALQHVDGNARFVMIDGLSDAVRKNSNMPHWLRLMERFGFPVETVDAKEAAGWLTSFKEEHAAGPHDENVYIMGFGMDRCSNFTDMNLSGFSGADSFQDLMQRGTEGVHFICWWSNVTTYNSHIGFTGDGYMGTKVLLRMDQDTARSVLGPFISWGVRNNRAYIHDNSELADDSVVMPILPISDRVCGMTEAEAW